jgi:glycosyltransferase involved in cell wall biosynthesis
LDVSPHGVPDLRMVESSVAKPARGLTGRKVILSFGLLGPGKGYELALHALPAVVAAHPTTCYVIVGATHPELVRREGEAYRESLVDIVARLGLTEHVRFVDRFVGRSELISWLQSADVFVTPYPNLEQIVSGTLSYAMGAGRAIVSTPYTYAAELLADDRGMLVQPGSAGALATALNDLLGDDAQRALLGARAYEYSRGMVWSQVGASYRQVFARVAAGMPAAVPAGQLATVNG